MKEGKKKKGKGSCATTFAHSATNLLNKLLRIQRVLS